MRSKVVEEFDRLQQGGSLEEYIDKFEELESLLLQKQPLMRNEYFLDSFIGGLKPQIKPFVKAVNPDSLSKAIGYAKLQEETIEALKSIDKHSKPSITTPTYSRNSQPILPTPNTATRINSTFPSLPRNPMPNPSPATRPRFIPALVRAKKMAKGLSYYCDKPFERGHKCANKGTQLFLVEVVGEEEQEMTEIEQLDTSQLNEEWQGDPLISLHAISGSTGYQTILEEVH